MADYASVWSAEGKNHISGGTPMWKYEEVAVRATAMVASGEHNSPEDAWRIAANSVFVDKMSSQEKPCPRSAFLGLCEAGLVRAIPSGNYHAGGHNKAYAIRAVGLLMAEPEFANLTRAAAWRRVMDGSPTSHNGQMDVVLGLHRNGLLNIGDSGHIPNS